MLITFTDASDLSYFLNHKADHFWLSMYDCKKINKNTLYLNDSFYGLIEPTKKNQGMNDKDCMRNKKLLFTRNADLDGDNGISFLDKIIIN